MMPFGLTEALAIFQKFMNNILRKYLNVFCTTYLNDILIYNRTRKKHLSHVRKVLEFLKQAGLYAKIQKCEFFKNETIFLGVIVGKDGIRMNPQKIETIQNWQIPFCLTNIQAFIEFSNFYRRFVRNFSKIIALMVALTRKEIRFHWNTACQTAFDRLKHAFTTAPVLAPFD
jgi:hypothetical protein